MSIRQTDTHVYFWGSYLSNFAEYSFDFQLAPDTPPLRMKSSEHAFMALKALTFGDYHAIQEIINAPEPKDAKALGRKVKGFNEDVWSQRSYKCMFDACVAKFEQNPDILEQLIATAPRTIVEGSPKDRIWGVGLHWNDDAILDEANWLGENRLGKILMQVRWSFIKNINHGTPIRYSPSKVLGTL